MKIIANDASELQVQQVTGSGDHLQILSLEDPATLRAFFEDPLKVKKLTVQERGQIVAEYKGYTDLYSIAWTPGGIYIVTMYKPDQTPEVQTEKAQAAVLVAQIQAQELTDAQAITVKAIYPMWESVIGQTVKIGYKFQHDDKLYKTIQDNLLIQAQYVPGDGTESLYTVIDETHAGTQEDPIPYDGNMALEGGKYYIQDETVYKCTRDTEIPVYNALADLVGIYVEVAE